MATYAKTRGGKNSAESARQVSAAIQDGAQNQPIASRAFSRARTCEYISGFYYKHVSKCKPRSETRASGRSGCRIDLLLQGPPGTGKTTWITELMLQIYRREPKARILLASQSNVAIDHAFSKFMKIVEQHAHEFRQAPIAVRIGNEKIGESVQQWTIDPALQRWVEHLEDNVDGKIWSIMDRIQDPARYNRVLDIYNDWKTMFGKDDEMKPLFLAQSPTLIGATCMGSYPLYQWDLSFDWVIIDEAGEQRRRNRFSQVSTARRSSL